MGGGCQPVEPLVFAFSAFGIAHFSPPARITLPGSACRQAVPILSAQENSRHISGVQPQKNRHKKKIPFGVLAPGPGTVPW